MFLAYAGLQVNPSSVPGGALACVTDVYADCGPTADPYWDSVVLHMPLDGDLTDLKGHTFTQSGTSFVTTPNFNDTYALNIGGAGGVSSGFNHVVSTTHYADLWLGGDFTIECWFFNTEADAPRPRTLIRVAEEDGTTFGKNYFNVSISETGSDQISAYYPTNVSLTTNISAPFDPPVDAWHHVAFTRNGSEFLLFVNGVRRGRATSTYFRPTSTARVALGNTSVSDAFAGLIEGVRITNGVARYIDDFNPLTAKHPVTLDSTWSPTAPRTVLLVHADAVLADDSCAQPKTLTIGGATSLTEDEFQFGGSALSIPNAGTLTTGGLHVQRHQDFQFGTEDFTVECWAYRISNAFIGQLWTFNSQTSSSISVGTDGLIDALYATAGPDYTRSNIATFPTGQWVHVALQRRSGTFELYLNGTLADSIATTGEALSPSTTWNANVMGFGGIVSSTTTSSQQWNGYIDEIRVTKGAARYTGSFSVATLPSCPIADGVVDAPAPPPTPQPPSPDAVRVATVTGAVNYVGATATPVTDYVLASVATTFAVALEFQAANLPAGFTLALAWTQGPPGSGDLKLTGVSAVALSAAVQVTYLDADNIVLGSSTHWVTIQAPSPAPAPVPAPVPAPAPPVPVGDPFLSSTLALLRFDAEGQTRQTVVGGTQFHYFYAPGLTYFDLPESVLDADSVAIEYVVDGGTFDSGPTDYTGAQVTLSGRRVTVPAPFGVSLGSCSYRLTTTDVTGWRNERDSLYFTNMGGRSAPSEIGGTAIGVDVGQSAVRAAPASWDTHLGGLTVECMVRVDPDSFVAQPLTGRALTTGVLSPVVSVTNPDGRLLWALALGSWAVRVSGSVRRVVCPVFISRMAAGSPGCFIAVGRELDVATGGAFHLCGVIGLESGAFKSAVWDHGVRGPEVTSQPAGDRAELLAGAALRIGGTCPLPPSDASGIAAKLNRCEPLIAVVDELRITAAARHLTSTTTLAVADRTAPWPNY